MRHLFTLSLLATTVLFTACGLGRYERFRGYLEEKEYRQGINYFNNVIRRNQGQALIHFDIHRYVLRCYRGMGQLHRGYKYYTKFKDPALRLYIRGLYDAFIGIHESAISFFKRAAKYRPGEYIIYYDMGLSYMKLRKFHSAGLAFIKCIQRNGGFAHAYYDLGLVYSYQKKYQISRSYIERALKKFVHVEKSAMNDAYISLGKIYEILGDKEAAITAYESAARKDFRKLIWAVDLGMLYYETKRFGDAQRFWRRALGELGYNNPRGRYYFKRVYGSEGKVLDLSGIPYYYITTFSIGGKDRVVFANEEEYFFRNPKDSGLYSSFKSHNLIDHRQGYERWRVEHLGFASRLINVRRWLQSRGVIGALKFKNGERIYVSVKKDEKEYTEDDALVIGEEPPKRKYWTKSDCKLGYYRGRRHLQTMRFPCKHLYRVALFDVDQDGKEDIVAAGFDNNDRFKVTIYKQRGNRFSTFDTIVTDMKNNSNGLMFIDVSTSKGIEVVRFSTAIAWADVYQYSDNGYSVNNRIFKNFAEEFVRKYYCFQPGYSSRMSRYWRVPLSVRRQYSLYARYLPRAKAIIR